MGERLSWEEIKRRYPDQYVILVEVEADEGASEIRAGVVFAHSSDRKQLLSSTKQALAGKSRTVLFTGEVGKGLFLFEDHLV